MLLRLVEYEYLVAFSLEYAMTRIRCHAPRHYAWHGQISCCDG